MKPKFPKENFRLFLKFLKFLIPYRNKQVFIILLSGFSVLFSLVNPYLSKLIVDKAFLAQQLRPFVVFGLLSGAIFAMNGIAKMIGSYLGKGVALRVRFDLNKKVFTHLQDSDLCFFKDSATGEHMFKLSYDIERIVDFIVDVPRNAVMIFPKLIFTFVIIAFLDWQMALFIFFLTPSFYIPFYFFTRMMVKVWREFAVSSQKIFKFLEEVFSHIYLIKAFGKEKREVGQYLKMLAVNTDIGFKNAKLEVGNEFASWGFGRMALGALACFGALQVIDARMSLGTFTAIMIYMAELVGLHSSFGSFFQRVSHGFVSCKRIDAILEKKSASPVSTPGVETGRVMGFDFQEPRVSFNKVSFGYSKDANILENIDFCIKKGTIALVGPSGCGKTTILNLILGLYKPLGGAITIGAVNLNDLDLLYLRDEIGIALQDPFLWDDTIENNIRYAKEDATREEVVAISKLVGVDEFASALPQGYATVIGENACRLSEGQKQKIAIARALIKKPKILILDEAMSSMDSRGEEKIIAEVKKLPFIYTTIIVSHRLSTVLAADLVYFLKNKSRMDIATPLQMIQDDPVFQGLFAGQSEARQGSIL